MPAFGERLGPDDIEDVAVGHLLDDGGHLVLAVRDEGLLLDLLLRHDGVVAAGMAGSAVGREDALSVLEVGGQRRAAAENCGEQAECSAEGERAERTAGLNGRRGCGLLLKLAEGG